MAWEEKKEGWQLIGWKLSCLRKDMHLLQNRALCFWTLRCPQGSIKNNICPFLSCSPPSTISGNPGSLALCLLTQLKGKGWRGDITYPVHSWAQVARDPSFRILKEAPAPFDSGGAEMDGWVSWGEPVIFELLEDLDRHREDLPGGEEMCAHVPLWNMEKQASRNLARGYGRRHGFSGLQREHAVLR